MNDRSKGPERGRHSSWLLACAMWFAVAVPAAAADLTEGEKAAVMGALGDFDREHEGRPQGVPQSYDWYARPRMKRGNNPGSNLAMTGWGHIFWAQGATAPGPDLELQNLRVWICSGTSQHWQLVQRGSIYGRQYDADFSRNTSQAARVVDIPPDGLRVSFAPGAAFHFWPKGQRALLPGGPLCGVVVVVQARQVRDPGGAEVAPQPYYLIGLGADYWRNRTASWEKGGVANPGIAIGRLKYVTAAWQWYALVTANRADALHLVDGGYTTAPVQK